MDKWVSMPPMRGRPGARRYLCGAYRAASSSSRLTAIRLVTSQAAQAAFVAASL